jgi:hypothetical protein
MTFSSDMTIKSKDNELAPEVLAIQPTQSLKKIQTVNPSLTNWYKDPKKVSLVVFGVALAVFGTYVAYNKYNEHLLINEYSGLKEQIKSNLFRFESMKYEGNGGSGRNYFFSNGYCKNKVILNDEYDLNELARAEGETQDKILQNLLIKIDEISKNFTNALDWHLKSHYSSSRSEREFLLKIYAC